MGAREREITPRQREVLEFIQHESRANGYPPTIREIGDFFGIASVNGVACHLRALERAGLLRRAPGRSRAMVALGDNPVRLRRTSKAAVDAYYGGDAARLARAMARLREALG